MQSWAQESSNPYQPIVERNVFGIKPPPDPTLPPPPPPPAPMAKVILTGIHSVLGPPRAFVEITEQEPGGKTPNVKKPTMREGDREGAVELISIDVANSTCKFRIGGVETDITFETPKMSGGPAPGGPAGAHPGVMPAASPAVKLANAMTHNAAAASATPTPTIISRTPAGTPVDRSGVTLLGAPATPAVATVGSSSYVSASRMASGGAYVGSPTLGFGSSASATVAANNNSGISTARQTRTTTTTPAAPVDPVAQYINMKLSEERARQRNVPHPPTPPLPPSWGGTSPPMPGGE